MPIIPWIEMGWNVVNVEYQGDADPIVPYSQNVRLRDALTKASVPNELFTVPGGGHGNFKPDERSKIYLKIREFLTKNGL